MFLQPSHLVFSQIHWFEAENFRRSAALGVFKFSKPNGKEA